MFEIMIRTPEQAGAALRRARTKAGITQTEPAAKAGLRQETVSRAENGNGALKLETLCRLLAALDTECVLRPRTKNGLSALEDMF